MVAPVLRVPLLAFGCVCLLVPLVLACSGERPAVDAATQRTLAQGAVVGASIEDGAVHAWRGLPFAAPPVEGLRWKAPRPPAA